MKIIYLLLIVSLISCLTTKEKIKCITENENLLEQVAKVIDAFKTKDFRIILNTILSSYYSVKDNIKDCLNDEPNLSVTYCGFICHGYSDQACLDRCKERVEEKERNEREKERIRKEKGLPKRITPIRIIRIPRTTRNIIKKINITTSTTKKKKKN